MKKLFLMMGAFVASTSVFAGFGWQSEFTNVQDNNLKGNVIAVLYSKYEYKENFGEPVPGKLQRMYVTFYDENGRSFLNRDLYSDGSYYTEAQSTLFDYTSDASGTTVHRPQITCRTDGKDINNYLPMLMALDNSFEQRMVSNSKCSNYLTIDYKYDKDQVLTTYTMLSNSKIVAKLVAKPTVAGVYEYTIYKASGDATEKGIRTYKNGKLIKVEKPNKMLMHSIDIESMPMGSYSYNANGKIQQYCQITELNTDGWGRGNTPGRKFVYNQQGDEIQWIDGHWGWGKDKGKMLWGDPRDIYIDYKYDANGNWIYRVDTQNNNKYIEIREIIYCSSKEELQQKSSALRQSAGELINSKQ